MASQKVNGFMWQVPGSATLQYVTHTCDMSSEGWIAVGPHNTVYEIPADFNPVAAEVAAIDKALDKMANAYHGKVAQLNQRKQELLCIENSPS